MCNRIFFLCYKISFYADAGRRYENYVSGFLNAIFPSCVYEFYVEASDGGYNEMRLVGERIPFYILREWRSADVGRRILTIKSILQFSLGIE